jgi:hypothetical protein
MRTAIGMTIYWLATVLALFLALGTVIVIAAAYFEMWGLRAENNILEAFVFIPALLLWLLGLASRKFIARR